MRWWKREVQWRTISSLRACHSSGPHTNLREERTTVHGTGRVYSYWLSLGREGYNLVRTTAQLRRTLYVLMFLYFCAKSKTYNFDINIRLGLSNLVQTHTHTHAARLGLSTLSVQNAVFLAQTVIFRMIWIWDGGIEEGGTVLEGEGFKGRYWRGRVRVGYFLFRQPK